MSQNPWSVISSIYIPSSPDFYYYTDLLAESYRHSGNQVGDSSNENLSGNNSDNYLYGGGGNDYLFGEDGNDDLNGGNGNDDLNGGTGNDALYGDDGNDALYGDNGNDRLNGGTGSDRLNGGNGNDRLFGDDGNDRLNGGAGSDTLNGGNGNDIFRFINLSKDTIKDFSSMDDNIQLENSAFTKLAKVGVLNAANFKIGAVATDKNDFIVYNSKTGALFYDDNGNEAGHSTQIAIIGTHLALTNADFVIT